MHSRRRNIDNDWFGKDQLISMDQLDIKLLSALEKNSRISLKQLAQELNLKTSGIYHRINKLRENHILDQFSIVVNPSALGYTKITIMIIHPKKMGAKKVESVLATSFAEYLAKDHEEVMFSSVTDDGLIYLIATFQDAAHLARFEKQLQNHVS